MKATNFSFIKIVFHAILFLIASSCSDFTKDTKTKTDSQEIETLKDFISSQGFDRNQIYFDGTKFIIEKDIFTTLDDTRKQFSESQKNFKSNTGRVLQRRGSYLVSDLYINKIYVYLDPSLPTVWVDATIKAIDDWNQDIPGTKVYFRRVYTQSQSNITVQPVYSVNGAFASTYLPNSNGAPGGPIFVNTYYNSSTNAGQKENAVAHEFGHTLGFRHTDSSDGTYISGTPVTDNESVMNSGSNNCFGWCGFSTGDINATQILYPCAQFAWLSYPNGGPDSYIHGVDFPIIWKSTCISSTDVKLEAYDYYGNLIGTIANSTPNNGLYVYSNYQGGPIYGCETDFFIKIISINNPSFSDLSDFYSTVCFD
jgi:hypothetical protein